MKFRQINELHARDVYIHIRFDNELSRYCNESILRRYLRNAKNEPDTKRALISSTEVSLVVSDHGGRVTAFY